MTLIPEINVAELAALLGRYGMVLQWITAGDPIPGSFWGDPEAGLIKSSLYVREDTPLHSALHEACHFICMDEARRQTLHTDSGGSDLEENGVCYLQILLADYFQGYSREIMFRDMDDWGYSFRLGSAKSWFYEDAEDARTWLMTHGLILPDDTPSWQVRDTWD